MSSKRKRSHMADNVDLIAILGSNATDGYGLLPIPTPIDGDVRNLIEAICQAQPVARTELISKLTPRHGFVMMSFAERMSSSAVRTGQVQFVLEGLIALAIADKLVDHREVLMVLSLVCRSAEKLGLDCRKSLPSAAGFDPDFHEVVSKFVNRNDELRSVGAMGFIESNDEDGFRYQRKPWGK